MKGTSIVQSYRDEAKQNYKFRCALKAGNEPDVSIPTSKPAA